VIELPNSTLTSSSPIAITHSVTIVGGTGSVLQFNQNGSTWPSTASGAIYVPGPTNCCNNIQITLENFTIDFANTPLVWSTSSGNYDPNNNGTQLAVINDEYLNQTYDTDMITLDDMTVDGPPAFDTNNTNNPDDNYTSLHNNNPGYVGEPAIPLLLTNPNDFGAVENSTFQGGPIWLSGGPWTVANNRVGGAVAGTYSTAAFNFQSAHDVLLANNQVTQTATTGTLFRLVDFGTWGIYNTVEGNTFSGGNVGFNAADVGYNAGDSEFIGLNDPEIMLQESNYVALFEGRPAAISSDGLILVLPDLQGIGEIGTTGYPTGPGMVVSILSGVNSGGSPDMNLAGEWFTVGQQVGETAGSDGYEDLVLLMNQPLPPMPAGGYYNIEVTTGFIDDSYIDNTISAENSESKDLSLEANDFGTLVIGNHLTGGGLVAGNYTGAAIVVGANFDAPLSPNALEGNTPLPSLGTVIEDNVIQDALGGVEIGVEHNSTYWLTTPAVGSASETGRVYVTATVIGNVFEQDYSWLQNWNSEYQSFGNSPGDVPSPGSLNDTEPPAMTVGWGFSGYAAGPLGPTVRFPWTVGGSMNDITPIFVDPTENVVDVQGNATYEIQSNGTLTLEQEPTGQVYAGIVNGAAVESSLAPERNTNTTGYGGRYYGLTYYPFNVDTLSNNPDQGNELNINGASTANGGLQALMLGQDGYAVVGSGSGSPAPDGFQDLHIQLVGLSPGSTVQSIVIIDNNDNEQWDYPQTGSSPQIAFTESSAAAATAGGSSTSVGNIFIQPTGGHLDDSFTLELTYEDETGGPITLPVEGVQFNPALPAYASAAPPAPVSLQATSVSTTQVALSWTGSPGATSYVVERSPASTPPSWAPIATDVTSTSYTDSTVASDTTYDYAVVADSAPGVAAGSATFVKEDTTTGGNWIGVYGSQGYDVADSGSSLTYGTVTLSGDATYQWSTSNPPALQIPGNPGSRIASCWDSSTSFTITVDLTDGQSHDMALYALDYDNQGRAERIQITTTGGTVLDTQSISNFTGGVYLQWVISGDVVITVTCTAGINGVVSGIFFDAPSIAGASALSQPIQVTTEVPVDNLTLTAEALTATQGVEFPAIVAYFADTNHNTPASDFTATVYWGDGLVTYDAPVISEFGEFYIDASHTYTTWGDVVLYVTVEVTGEPASLASTTSTAAVSPPNDQVSLSSYFNAVGITSQGSNVSGSLGTQGYDSYSYQALGGTPTIYWNATSFQLGGSNADNVIRATGQEITLDNTNVSSIEFLAAAMNGDNQGGIFTVDYSDGSKVEYTLGLSDWMNGYGAGNTNAPGEVTAFPMQSYDTYAGTSPNGSDVATVGNVNLYGYTVAVNPSKTVTGFTLPADGAIIIVAVDLISEPAQVNLANYYNKVAITEAGNTTAGQLTSPASSSYSYAALGSTSTITWGGSTFYLGQPDQPDAVSLSNQLIALPPGNYSSIELLAASTSGSSGSESVEIWYSTGDPTSETIALSDWQNGYNGAGTTAPGETAVPLSMSYYNTYSGGEDTSANGNVYLYAYTIPLNPAQTTYQLSLTGSSSVMLLAADLISQPRQANLGSAAGSGTLTTPFNAVGITNSLDSGRRQRLRHRGRLVLCGRQRTGANCRLGHSNVQPRCRRNRRRARPGHQHHNALPARGRLHQPGVAGGRNRRQLRDGPVQGDLRGRQRRHLHPRLQRLANRVRRHRGHHRARRDHRRHDDCLQFAVRTGLGAERVSLWLHPPLAVERGILGAPNVGELEHPDTGHQRGGPAAAGEPGRQPGRRARPRQHAGHHDDHRHRRNRHEHFLSRRPAHGTGHHDLLERANLRRRRRGLGRRRRRPGQVDRPSAGQLHQPRNPGGLNERALRSRDLRGLLRGREL
jgi:hypothetical protein